MKVIQFPVLLPVQEILCIVLFTPCLFQLKWFLVGSLYSNSTFFLAVDLSLGVYEYNGYFSCPCLVLLLCMLHACFCALSFWHLSVYLISSCTLLGMFHRHLEALSRNKTQ